MLQMKSLFRVVIAVLVLGCLGAGAWLLFRGRSLETEYAVNREAGKSLAAEGSYSEATTHLQESLEAARKLDPKDPRVDQAISDLADAYSAQGDYVETQHLYMEALQRTIEAHGSNSPQAAGAFNDLGKSARLQRRFEVAEGMYNQAIAVWDKIGTGVNPQAAAESYTGLALVLKALDRPDEAEKAEARAMALSDAATTSATAEVTPAAPPQ